MSDLTDYSEKYLLDYLLTGSSKYVALHTADPGEDGSTGEVDVGTDADYVRKAVTFGAATLGVGQSVNTSAVSWTVNSSSGGYTVTHGSIWDAASGGNCLYKAQLAVPKALVADEVFTMAVGEIIAALD